jgi:hypothetical protein
MDKLYDVAKDLADCVVPQVSSILLCLHCVGVTA